MTGILPLDKPSGISSTHTVNIIKRLLPRGTKIGHAGTLDPFATGALLLLVGKATKLCEQLMNAPKRYTARAKLGATTATDDPDSPEQEHPVKAIPTLGRVADELQQQIGSIQQLPPQFSALKLGGRRAYDLARKGEAVPLQPRTVRIDSIDRLDYAWPYLMFGVKCGRGTYIRAIARDLGQSLGVGGYLTGLRRNSVGDFGDVYRLLTLEQIVRYGVDQSVLVPIDSVG